MRTTERQQQDPATLHRQALDHLRAGRLPPGIALLEEALSLYPGSGDLHCDLATALCQTGQTAKAAAHYEKALRLGPKRPHVQNNYGQFVLQAGRIKDAERHFRKALDLKPDYPEALNNLALALQAQGQLDEAETLYINAIRLHPRWPNPHYNIGTLYLEKNFKDRAAAAFRKTVELFPGHAPAWLGLAQIVETPHDREEAIACLNKVIQLAPEIEDAWARLARIYESQNRLEEAREILDRGRKLFPDNVLMLLAEVKILRRQDRAETILPALEQAAGRLDKNNPASALVFHELARLYDSQDEADKAFAWLALANDLRARSPEMAGLSYESFPALIEEYRDIVRARKNKWSATPLPKGTPKMVFLVGFPRSGTTLLDQILSGHPAIEVAEEEGALAAAGEKLMAMTGLSVPASLDGLDDGGITALRETYFSTLKNLGYKLDGSGLFIDKLPLNLVHAPFIHRLFPDAQFILALRHPCDCVLSCAMQDFVLNESMIHMLDPGKAARLYDLCFTAWEEFTAALGLAVHTVRYESVVGDLRGEITKALEFLGLDWEDSVAAFDETAKERKIKTPSYGQVTRKIYGTAAGRWLKYRDHLAPAAAILAQWIEKYGYS